MGTYVTFSAKPGCADQINAAYAKTTGSDGWLVYSASVIDNEIAYIQSPAGKAQAHLRPHLKTVEDWNRLFPSFREGTGQIKISGIADDEMCGPLPRREYVRRSIAFLLEHRMLFARIDGLDDARDYGLTDCTEDRIENNKGRPADRGTVPTFTSLPKSRSALYKHCTEYDRPDLWEAIVKFRALPSWETWATLRDKVVPWVGGAPTVWQLAEAEATRIDARHYGLRGRFQGGHYPAEWIVETVLRRTQAQPVHEPALVGG